MRKKVVPILEDMNFKLGAGKKTMENIGELSKRDSVVVIGGQQPGLFTGPIFIIYKIITVLKLSQYLQENTGTRVIPCFWNASDDSSLDQADRLGIPGNQLNELKLDTSGINRGTRLSNIRLDRAAYLDVIKKIESILSGMGPVGEAITFLEGVLDRPSSADNGEGISLARLFSGIILELFSDWGPVMIDPSDSNFKKLGNDFLKWDMENYTKINKSILEQGEMLKEAGYHAQLEPDKDVLDFFINKNNIRTKIRISPDGGFILDGEGYSADEILEIANNDPSSVSWNVALRPLIQDTVFPVAATVCGPGEVSYFAQLRGVYGLKGMSMPIIYPRLSATIVEQKTSRLIERTGIGMDTLVLDRQDAERKLLKKEGDTGAEDIIGGLEAEILYSIRNAEEKIVKAGNDPGSSFDRIKRNLGSEIKVLSKKLYSALKKQKNALVKSIDRIYMDLFPEGDLQERKINVFYYISKYGINIISGLYDAYRPLEKGHILIYLEGEDRDEAG